MEWTGARYADQPEVEVETWVAAPPERVWPLVSDVEGMPARSGELQAVEWTDGATGPAAGARFVGRSSHPSLGDWSATATVVTCEPPGEFAWEVDGEGGPAPGGPSGSRTPTAGRGSVSTSGSVPAARA